MILNHCITAILSVIVNYITTSQANNSAKVVTDFCLRKLYFVNMRFYTDAVALTYSDVQTAKQWWINAFDCKVVKVPPDWDNQLPSDIALMLPRNDQPAILLSARAEVEQEGFDRPSPVVSVSFCDKLKQAYDQLSGRGIVLGPIQDGGDTQFFELRDSEENLIQVCKEP